MGLIANRFKGLNLRFKYNNIRVVKSKNPFYTCIVLYLKVFVKEVFILKRKMNGSFPDFTVSDVVTGKYEYLALLVTIQLDRLYFAF